MDISNVNGLMAGQRPPAPPPQAGGRGGPSFEEVLQNKDVDGDNALSIDEISISEEAFDKADLNKDGIVDRSEFESGSDRVIGDDLFAQRPEGTQPQMGPPPGAMQPGMGAMATGPSSYRAMMQPLPGGSDGQGHSMHGQYGTELENGIDLIV
ncbi:MAG: EF-hand domain-containing protein [Deltaproteobacteria bacterium]|nr:EF-hand domain-containing protein [Deltaproteobacteria bacterium]